jgi:hypothetical protein
MLIGAPAARATIRSKPLEAGRSMSSVNLRAWNRATSPALSRVRTGGGSGSPAVVDGSLILWPSASTPDSAALSDLPAASNGNTCESSVPRYVLVNDANLKTRAHCAQCGTEIGRRYVRAIAGRRVFCDFACYRCAAEMPAPCVGGSSANMFAASQCQGETK